MLSRRALAIALSLTAAVALTACTEVSRPIEATRTNTPTPEPVFPSDEAAREAGASTYGAFRSMLDTVEAEGGQGAERLDALATPEVIGDALQSGQVWQSLGLMATGRVTVTSVELVDARSQPDADGVVAALMVCEDESTRPLTRPDGASASRAGGTVVAYAVEIAAPQPGTASAGPYVVASREPQADASACG